jgi:glycosyltransferase involved in cell wall biosynthesis
LTSHFLIVPTKAECAGLVFQEAAAFGLPSISFNTGGVSSVLIDNITGMLLPPGSSPEDIAEKINQVWADSQLYKNLSDSAREYYEHYFTEEAWALQVNKILKNILEERKS